MNFLINGKWHIYNNRDSLTGLPQGQGHLIGSCLSIPICRDRDRCSILGYCRSQVRILRRKGDFQGIQIPILASNRERRRTIHPIKKLSILFTNGKGDFLPVFPLCHGHGGIRFQNMPDRRLPLFRLFLGFSLGFALLRSPLGLALLLLSLGLPLFRRPLGFLSLPVLGGRLRLGFPGFPILGSGLLLGVLALFVLRGGLRLGLLGLLILGNRSFPQGLGRWGLLRKDRGGQQAQAQGQN